MKQTIYKLHTQIDVKPAMRKRENCKFVADDVMCPKCSDCLRYKVTDSSYKFLTILNDFYVSVLGSAEITVRIRVTALEGRHGDDQSHSRDPRRNNFSD